MTANTQIARLFASFESCKFEFDGTEAWSARQLMPMLGYAAWQDFRNAVKRAWDSCNAAGLDCAANFLVSDGSAAWSPAEVFRDAPKNPMGGRPSEDVILTRRASYLVAMNGDPRKPEIAFAQHYFASATRKLEAIQQRLVEAERMTARGELTETESKFQGVLFEHGVDGDGIGRVRSKGDRILFGGNSTADMKEKWGVPDSRPLADFAPEVAIRAKQLGAAITAHNVRSNSLNGESAITVEHVENNRSIRQTLDARGIKLEQLMPEEDIKKVERRHASEAKKLVAPPKASSRKRKPNAA